MPCDPGRSYSYITVTADGGGSYTSEVVGDGRFVQSTEQGRPTIALVWVGPPSNADERVSFWYNGMAFLHRAPLRTEVKADNTLWGFFAVDVPTRLATAMDVLQDHNGPQTRGPAAAETMPSGWKVGQGMI